MCNHVPNREAAMVAWESPTGPVWCDPCLVPLVRALNDGGIRTVASCCGHGHRPGSIVLADGREIVILPDQKTARMVDALFPVDINGVDRTHWGRVP